MTDAPEVSRHLTLATELHGKLCRMLDGLTIPSDLRGRLAGGCFYIALDLHASTIALVERQIVSGAFILARPSWEAVIRGLWLSHCADELALERFRLDEGPHKIGQLIADLEKLQAFEVNVLSSINGANRGRYNAMTHVGGPLAVRCNTADHVEPNFDPVEIIECLTHASAVAEMAALGLAQLANNGTLAMRLRTKMVIEDRAGRQGVLP